MRPRRTSVRLEAAAEAALLPLLRFLAGDSLRAILKLLGGVDLTCARLACRDFRDHSSPAQEAMRRSDFLCTRALVVYTCERMLSFVRNLPRAMRLAASVAAWVPSRSWSTTGSARSQPTRAWPLLRTGSWTR